MELLAYDKIFSRKRMKYGAGVAVTKFNLGVRVAQVEGHGSVGKVITERLCNKQKRKIAMKKTESMKEERRKKRKKVGGGKE